VKLVSRAERTGSVEPSRQGRPPGGGKLAAHQAFLVEQVEARPDITMPELSVCLEAQRGVSAHPASLSRVLCAWGFSFKKNSDGLGTRARRRA
jgi:transposase